MFPIPRAQISIWLAEKGANATVGCWIPGNIENMQVAYFKDIANRKWKQSFEIWLRAGHAVMVAVGARGNQSS